MKTLKISELKTHLSRHLKAVRNGARILVLDRDEPVAEIVPVGRQDASLWQRLAREGSVRLGSQQWETLEISSLGRRVAVQDALDAVREENE